ncbi:MAG: cysteine desulfurase family protein [Candidatus Omnitrophota bacterium]
MEIYLDNAATSMIDPRVSAAMLSCQDMKAMNASSAHKLGVVAAKAIEKARAVIAREINAEPQELIFTSGGTESNNLALKGTAFANRERGKHIIVSQIEHMSVMETAQWLETQGFQVTYLPVDREGFVSPKEVEKAIKRETILVSIAHANNEVGTIEPIDEIGAICRSKKVYFHSDACQSFTKVKLDVKNQNLDLVSLNAHKIHGPKGVGALYVRNSVKMEPLLHGGGQEGGLRSGTHHVEGIVGFGKAAEIAGEVDTAKLATFRDDFIQKIQSSIEQTDLNGPRVKRLCNNINLRFRSVNGQSLSRELSEKNIYVSAGSACLSTKVTPSHVLLAMGLEPERAQEAIRISLSRFTTPEEVDLVVQSLSEIVRRSRKVG